MASAGTYIEANALRVYNEINRMEGSVAYCARRSALVRERSIVVNSCSQHPARPPC
jgi:hypothetical protein